MTSTPVVLAFDVGTSGVKGVLVDAAGDLRHSGYRAYGLETLPGGGVEQDLGDIVEALAAVSRDLADAAAHRDWQIHSIVVTAQMFNLAAVDEHGVPVGMMLSWLDQRADRVAADLGARIEDQTAVFGCHLTAKDIVPRIEWLRQVRPDQFSRARWLLDCKEAVVMWLTGVAVIDPTGATAFRLASDDGTHWDLSRCAAAGVDPGMLPEIRSATAIAGGLRPAAAEALGLPAGTQVYVGAGDVPASQLGSGAVHPGDVHLSLGTAAYFGLVMADMAADPRGVLAPLAHVEPGRWILWLETATGGAALAWALRLTGLNEDGPDYSHMDRLVAEAEAGMDDLLLAPWFSGERVPLFDDSLRGVVVGLGLHHGPGHLIRAAMLGVAYQLRWSLDYSEGFGHPVRRIVAVGGGALGTTWAQLIADVAGRDLECLVGAQDAAAVGAAACALVGGGMQRDFDFLAERTVQTVRYRFDEAAHRGHTAAFARFTGLVDVARQARS